MNTNHFKTIWLQPRETLQEIVDTRPGSLFFVLAAVWGTHAILQGAVFQQAVRPDSWITVASILPIGMLVGTIAGIGYFYAFSFLLGLGGRLLGGSGSFTMARTVMAWASVPYIPLLIIDILLLLYWGEATVPLTLRELRERDAGSNLALVTWFELYFRIAMSTWGCVIYVRGFAQVFKLPIGKSLLATGFTEGTRMLVPIIAWARLFGYLMLPISGPGD